MKRLDFAPFPANVEIVSAVVDEELVLFCGLVEENAVWKDTAELLVDILFKNLGSITIAVSSEHRLEGEIYTAYQEGRKTLLWHNVYGQSKKVEYFDCQHQMNPLHGNLTDLEQMCRKMAQKVRSLDADSVWEYFYKKGNGKFQVIRLMLMLFTSKVIEEKMAHFQWIDTLDMTVYELSKLNHLEDAKAWLEHFFDELDNIYEPAGSALVQNVLEYIKNHITEGLSLENVAAQFYVSPNYLSTLIRKETGITYRQHIINAKMTVAKYMLDDTRMLVEDVAYAIGYENYISFYNVFKKTEGISPSEYRFRNKNE